MPKRDVVANLMFFLQYVVVTKTKEKVLLLKNKHTFGKNDTISILRNFM